MPDTWSSCGELNAPPHRITSPAVTVRCRRRQVRYSTPVARRPSKTHAMHVARVTTSRFGRSITGCR